MILEGPTITDPYEKVTPAALSIAQLLKVNSIKPKRKEYTTKAASVCHSAPQETPCSSHLQYIRLMLHGHTQKKELIDRLYHLGLSISYNRIICVSAQMGNRICKHMQFHNNHVVCPPRLCGSVFITSAVDNIDYNPSSTTSKESFHTTGISLNTSCVILKD